MEIVETDTKIPLWPMNTAPDNVLFFTKSIDMQHF